MPDSTPKASHVKSPSPKASHAQEATLMPMMEPAHLTPDSEAPVLVLDNGQYHGTSSQAQLNALLDSWVTGDGPMRPLVVHFHGGLVSEAAGREVAAKLAPIYRDADGHPLFFVWRTGILETLRTVLPELAKEKLFSRIASLVLDRARGKVSPAAMAGAASTPLGLDVSEAEEKAFMSEVDADPTIVAIRAQIQKEVFPATLLGASRPGGPVRASSLTLMDPDVVAAIRSEPGEGKAQPAFLGWTRIAIGAAKVLVNVVRRHIANRDHGLHATVIEELCRAFYLANVGGRLWGEMKGDVAEAFAGSAARCGGTALVERIAREVRAGRAPRVVLVGHSAGSIFVSTVLQKIDEALRGDTSPAATAFRADVAFLAPAVTHRRFAEVIERHGHRIGAFRMFTMTDAAEKADRLVDAAALQWLYPHSLLYFISGVLEGAADTPLVGMQRYLVQTRPYGGPSFADVERVRAWLSAVGGRLVYSPTTDAEEGLRSTARDHGAFDDDDATRASLQSMIRSRPMPKGAPAIARAALQSSREVEQNISSELTDRLLAREFTGRYLVRFHRGRQREGMKALWDLAGIPAEVADGAEAVGQMGAASVAAVAPELDVAVMSLTADQLARLPMGVGAASLARPIVGVAPERRVYAARRAPPQDAIASRLVSPLFLDGYAAGVAALARDLRAAPDGNLPADALAPQAPLAPGGPAPAGAADSWALRATGVLDCRLTGRGVTVAVLDSGFDDAHPDFAARPDVIVRSFLPDSADTRDRFGHGMHCAGLLAGPASPSTGMRYGVAPEVRLLVGKVLNDQGSGNEFDVIYGLAWAVQQGAAIVSMSLVLGAANSESDAMLESILADARQDGVLVIAAVGNDSIRSIGRVSPVRRPASFRDVVAVASVDPSMRVSEFSNAGAGPRGEGPDIAAPGRDVLSASLVPPYTRLESGTSMATPLVAGVAALWAERSGRRGQALAALLAQSARPLRDGENDVGRGVVYAPDAT